MSGDTGCPGSVSRTRFDLCSRRGGLTEEKILIIGFIFFFHRKVEVSDF